MKVNDITDDFWTSNEFAQVRFLDNFIEHNPIDEVEGKVIYKTLSTAVDKSPNQYVRRTAFKILCDLTLIGKITNRHLSLGHLVGFLESNNSQLEAIALKYLPHFKEAVDTDMELKLKQLSDSDNGDVASQAYFCLGFLQLLRVASGTDVTGLIVRTVEARKYFTASDLSTENRADARYYLLILDMVEAIVANNRSAVQEKLTGLETNLRERIIYEFDYVNLTLEYVVFQLVKNIKKKFEIISNSNQWYDVQSELQQLLLLGMETQKFADLPNGNRGIVHHVLNATLKPLEVSLYEQHLTSEEQRLKALSSNTIVDGLKEFIEGILSILPEGEERSTENPELIALLVENLGSGDGLRIYKKVQRKEITTEKALTEFFRNSNKGQLPIRTGSIQGQEALFDLMSEIDTALPNYPPEKREAFFNVLEEVIRYTRATFVGHEKSRFLFLYSESAGGSGQKAVEQDLQDSMYAYLEQTKIADGLGHELSKFVDGGRVDIVYKKDIITVPIELKKSLVNPNNVTLEQNYIAQAQTYTAGYDQLGIFVMLELSNKSTPPPPNIKDWFNVHHLTTSSNISLKHPDLVVSVVIPGNRVSPSSKSKYK